MQIDAAALREWLQTTALPSVGTRAAEQADLVHAVLSKLATDDLPLPTEVLNACVVMLMGARSDLDRLELELMRAASSRGHNWTLIAEAFGFRSKQAAHARASALHHRLEYRTADPEKDQR